MVELEIRLYNISDLLVDPKVDNGNALDSLEALLKTDKLCPGFNMEKQYNIKVVDGNEKYPENTNELKKAAEGSIRKIKSFKSSSGIYYICDHPFIFLDSYKLKKFNKGINVVNKPRPEFVNVILTGDMPYARHTDFHRKELKMDNPFHFYLGIAPFVKFPEKYLMWHKTLHVLGVTKVLDEGGNCKNPGCLMSSTKVDESNSYILCNDCSRSLKFNLRPYKKEVNKK